MSTPVSPASYTDATVTDSAGDKVGTVKRIFVDAASQQPSWAVVSTGLFGTKESFIPLAQATFEQDEIRVPFTEATVKDAPSLEEDGELTTHDEWILTRYYDEASTEQS